MTNDELARWLRQPGDLARLVELVESGCCVHGIDPTWCSVCLHGVDEERLTVSRKPKGAQRFPQPRPEQEPRWGRLGYDPRYSSDVDYPLE